MSAKLLGEHSSQVEGRLLGIALGNSSFKKYQISKSAIALKEALFSFVLRQYNITEKLMGNQGHHAFASQGSWRGAAWRSWFSALFTLIFLHSLCHVVEYPRITTHLWLYWSKRPRQTRRECTKLTTQGNTTVNGIPRHRIAQPVASIRHRLADKQTWQMLRVYLRTLGILTFPFVLNQ